MSTGLQTEYALGPISQIPAGEGREFVLAGVRVAVFHLRTGVVCATQPDCPHREGPLVDGLLGGTTLICPMHAWKFDLTTGRPLLGTCGLTTYPARLTEAGEIMVTL